MIGAVTWDPWRSLWNGGMLIGAVVLAPRYFTWGAVAAFLVAAWDFHDVRRTHSVGFHRRLIHRTFQCPKWLERVVGFFQTPRWYAGANLRVIQSHDFRDWAQRQPNCHPYLRHGQGMIKDAFWNLHCRLKAEPPAPIRSWPWHR